MRQPAEDFSDQEPELIYVAKRLADALRLEKLLTEAGIDYAVETGKYVAGFLFRTERVGAFFYVLPSDRDAAGQILLSHRFKPHKPQTA